LMLITSAATRPRNSAAIAFPSMILAVISFLCWS
jgi:hypothetical protein